MILELLIWIAVGCLSLSVLGMIADRTTDETVAKAERASDKLEEFFLGKKEEPTGVGAPADSKIRF